MTPTPPSGWIDSDPDGRTQPPLVLLHGFLGCARDWSDVIELLRPRWRCIAFDLPGHGRQPAPVPKRADAFQAVVEWIASRVTEQGIERFHLLGYSLGGRLALGLVCLHPGLLRRAVLLGATPGLKGEGLRSERRALDEARARALEERGLTAFLSDWYAQPLFRDLARHERFPETLRLRLTGDAGALAAALRGLSPGAQPEFHDCLAGTKVPLLFVAGGNDTKYAAGFRELATSYASVRSAVIADAGHSVHLEKPAALAALVAEFLQEPEVTEDG